VLLKPAQTLLFPVTVRFGAGMIEKQPVAELLHPEDEVP
jgi:hypothetical protein